MMTLYIHDQSSFGCKTRKQHIVIKIHHLGRRKSTLDWLLWFFFLNGLLDACKSVSFLLNSPFFHEKPISEEEFFGQPSRKTGGRGGRGKERGMPPPSPV